MKVLARGAALILYFIGMPIIYVVIVPIFWLAEKLEDYGYSR